VPFVVQVPFSSGASTVQIISVSIDKDETSVR
jgi:hypothetical protein